jgi:hypothetical protein
MAKLATCPSCTTQLALPEQATLSDRARCPRCQDEFLLMETVQFSIPEAEILPPSDAEAETAATAVADDEYSPALFMREELAEDTTESIEMEAIETPTSEPLSPSATLSDWEARLKRAIAENIDDDPQPAEINRPSFDFGSARLGPTNSDSLAEPEEYEVADEDLFPKTESRKPMPEPVAWSPADAYAPDDSYEPEEAGVDEPEYAPTIEQIAANIKSEREIPFDVQTSSKPRTKRKRSLVRTLASASLGVVGIPLGLYALLWLRGPAGDMLHVAQYIPAFMLPASFEEPDFTPAAGQIAEQPLPSITPETPPAEELLAETNDTETDFPAAEPLVREDAAVAPASAEVPAYRGPSLELVNPQEFSELFAAAQEVANQLGEGDLSTRESVSSKGQAYMSLARLAEKSSYMNQPGLTPDDMTKALSAKRLFANLLDDPVVQRDLPQIALRWWQYAGRPNPGMIFIGKVERIEETAAGPLAYITLGSATAVPAVPVLIGNANHAVGDEIGIVGKILPKPQETLPELDTTLEAVVIDFYSFPVSVTASN